MLSVVVGLSKIIFFQRMVHIGIFPILLVKWEIFKYLYLVRNKAKNIFLALNFRYYENPIHHNIWKRSRKHKLYML
jgi:hypothetical protein